MAGVGIMGHQIAQTLRDEGNEVTAVDIRPERVERLRESLGDSVMEGDCCDPVVLERAHLKGHDALLALTGDDEDNLVTSFLAKTHFDVPRVVARVNDPRNSWLFGPTWGVDVAMSAPNILLSLVEEATSSRATVNLMDLATAGVRVVEASIGPASPYLGRPLGELPVSAGCVVATVVRDGKPLVPRSDTVLVAGDHMLVVVQRGAEDTVDSVFSDR